MRNISNTTRFTSNSSPQREDGDIGSPVTGQEFYKDLIRRANTVPIIEVFKHYGLHINESNRKIICPIPSHKEGTASFWYYPHTNTFWCFGCKSGNTCCDFISIMDGITKTKAASKVLELFSPSATDEILLNQQDFYERLEIMLEFSNCVREFHQLNDDEKSVLFIEHLCSIYDTINAKHKLNNSALRSVVNQLKEKVYLYTPCLTL